MKDLVDLAKAKTPGFGDRILGKDGAALLGQATLTRTPRT